MPQAAAIALHTPATLRQFREDMEIVQDELQTALRGVAAHEQELQARETLKRCRKSMENVGRALLRMHSTSSWRNNFSSWNALCRHLEIHKAKAGYLMNYAASVDENDPKLLAAAAPDGLSRRQAIALHEAGPEERESVLKEAAATGDLPAAMVRLTESLRAAPATELNEAEVPKQTNHKRADGNRNLTKALNYLAFHGLLDQAMPPIANPTARAYGDALKKLIDSTPDDTLA